MDMDIEPMIYRFSVKQFQLICQKKILSSKTPMELIHGEIYEMAEITGEHAAHVTRMANLFQKIPKEKTQIYDQSHVCLDEYSEFIPDLSLLKPRPDSYEDSYPQPDDVFLIVEVSDVSIDYDKEMKLPIYARCEISELWIVDLNKKAIEIYREPSPDGYQQIHIPTSEETFSPLSFPELVLTPNDIFG